MRLKMPKTSPLFRILMGLIILAACAILALPNGFLRKTYVDTGLQVDNSEGSYLHYLDVGQGDCTAISSKDRLCLIDVGNTSAGTAIVSKLKALGFHKVDFVLITHAHYDHIGGLRELLKGIEVGTVYLPDWEPESKGDLDFLNDVRADCKKLGVTLETMGAEDKFKLGDFEIDVLYIDREAEDENDRSAIIKARCKGNSFLFTGDATSEIEEKLMNRHIDLSCDILKAGHHGSKHSTSSEFLSRTGAGLVIFSCGKDNSYGHPAKATIDRLLAREVDWFRTDINGDITVDAVNLTVKAEHGTVTDAGEYSTAA